MKFIKRFDTLSAQTEYLNSADIDTYVGYVDENETVYYDDALPKPKSYTEFNASEVQNGDMFAPIIDGQLITGENSLLDFPFNLMSSIFEFGASLILTVNKYLVPYVHDSQGYFRSVGRYSRTSFSFRDRNNNWIGLDRDWNDEGEEIYVINGNMPSDMYVVFKYEEY